MQIIQIFFSFAGNKPTIWRSAVERLTTAVNITSMDTTKDLQFIVQILILSDPIIILITIGHAKKETKVIH